MSLDTRVAAFTEYVLRPMAEDLKVLVQELKTLPIGVTSKDIRRACFAIGLWHFAGEVIRALSYLGVTWLICQAVVQIWPQF